MDLIRCDVVLATATPSCLAVELYRGPFTKLSRVDLAKEVATDTNGHIGGLWSKR
jgi:hypothetical protein